MLSESSIFYPKTELPKRKPLFLLQKFPMKKSLALFLFSTLFYAAFAQDRQGKQIDENGESKRYNFSFQKTKMAEGVSVSLPKGFRTLEDGEMKLKYPNWHRPVHMMTSEDQVADFGYNISFNQWGSNLKLLKDFMKANHSFYFTDIQYMQDTVVNLNGRNYVLLEFLSFTKNKETDRELAPIRNYSYMMYTVEDNRILVFNYTCPARYMDKWKQAAPTIMNSIAINPTLDLSKAQAKFQRKQKARTRPICLNTKTTKKRQLHPKTAKQNKAQF